MIRLAAWLLIALALGSAVRAAEPKAADTSTEAGIPAGIRVGDHADFGRIVFDVAPDVRYQLVRDGDTVSVRFSGETMLRPAPPAPRNVKSIRVMPGQADIVMAQGASMRDVRYGGRVVIDVFDPPADAQASARADAVPKRSASAPSEPRKPVAEPAPKSAPAEPKAQTAAPAKGIALSGAGTAKPKDAPAAKTADGAANVASKPDQPAPVAMNANAQSAPAPKPNGSASVEKPETAPAAKLAPDTKPAPQPLLAQGTPPAPAPQAASQPEPLLPRPAPPAEAPPPQPAAKPPAQAALVAPSEGLAFTVPMGPQAGAALFLRHGVSYVVFDERRPINLTPLNDNKVFADAGSYELQSGTLVKFRPPPGMAATLARVARGWKIAVLRDTPKPWQIVMTINGDKISLPAEAPGSVVSLADPDTGSTLLVGTLRRPGQAVLTARHLAELRILPAMQGVVIEPLGDTVTLRTVGSGFQITSEPAGLAITPPSSFSYASQASAHLTHRYNFPHLSAEALVHRMTRGVAEAAITSARARGPKRRAVAETMLALGLGAEAEALLQVTADQDPREAESPDVIGLMAVAALLAGRPEEASGIDDPRLSGTDEIALWRAVRRAMLEEGSPQAATVFASTASLAMLYPQGIRDRILPLMLETMILGGELAPANRLMTLLRSNPGQEMPNVSFARALLKQAGGDVAGALADLDALTAGHDQSDRARAGIRAVELRLAGGQLDAGKAADALDKLRYAWRGDRRELALRERIADLRQRAGAWRQALTDLRSAEADFPNQAQSIRAHLSAIFAALLDGETIAALPPLELVTLVDENADLLRGIPESSPLQERLADRLLALDLPSRAGPLLEKLQATAAGGAERAGFGTRLAEMRLRENDAPGALAALAGSDAPDLPPALAEKRAYLAASAQARRGDARAAISALERLSGPAADAARATIYEQAGDWPAAERVLVSYVAGLVPESGDLNDLHRQALLRLATATARAGDNAALAALRVKEDARMGTGPLAELFRLLTTDPVRGTSDLGRSEKEMGLARALPAGLQALKAATTAP